MKVVSAAVCPMTPLVLRHLAGLHDPVAELRAAAVTAVRDALVGADQVLVLCPVGGREAPGDWRDPSHSGPAHGEPVSLAAQVAGELLDLADCSLPTAYADLPGGGLPDSGLPDSGERDWEDLLDDPDGAVALLVMGDGAAARGQGAPGHIDDRSFPWDDHVAGLLEAGDGAGLAALDEELGAALLATCRWSYPVLGRLVPRADAQLRWRGDPFGLTYFVALWRPLTPRL
jgi:hypothetical protein